MPVRVDMTSRPCEWLSTYCARQWGLPGDEDILVLDVGRGLRMIVSPAATSEDYGWPTEDAVPLAGLLTLPGSARVLKRIIDHRVPVE